MASKRRLNRSPGDEKYRDLKRVFSEYEDATDAEWYEGRTKNGAPIRSVIRTKNGEIIDGESVADYVGHGRKRKLKKERRRNGKKEWMGVDGDAWGKPPVHDKSSRKRMRELKERWEED